MRKALMKMVAVAGMVCIATSCATVYDEQGRPQQVVTPEGAALGIVAAGLIGYALNDNDHHHKNRRSHGGGGGYYGGGHGGRYCR
jgi:hypothetical protein